MTREKMRGAAVLAVTVLAVAGLARAASDERRERVKAFRKQAEAERAKSGLPLAALKKQYPTPEIQLARPLPLSPGKVAAVEVKGDFQEGSLFLVESDDVTVQSEQLTPAGWKAELAVRAGAPPQRVGLAVYAPVSACSAYKEAFLVAGRYACQAQLEGGLAVKLVARASEPGAYDAAWSLPPQGAPLLRTAAKVEPSYRSLAFEFERDEQALALEGQKAMGDAQPAMEEMQKCQKLPQAEMIACFQKAGERMKGEEAKRRAEWARKAPPCGTLTLSFDAAGAPEGGRFRACAGNFEDRVSKATCKLIE
jgi:hypothetical protein